MVLALDTQSSFSVHEMNSVGLKSGFLASLAALVLSSIFLEMVDLMVLAAGISMSLLAGLLASMLLGLTEEAVELVDEDEVVEEEDEEEQVLLSESESLKLVV